MNDCRFGVSPVNYPDPDPDPFSPMIMSKFCSRFYCFILTADCKLTKHSPAKCHLLYVKKGLLTAYVSFDFLGLSILIKKKKNTWYFWP